MRNEFGQVIIDCNNWPDEGYYKRREYSGGPWVPIRMWWVLSVRDSQGNPTSDDVLKAEENKSDSVFGWEEIDPYDDFKWMTKIEEKDFEWLIALKQ